MNSMTATEVKHMIKECGSKCELCGSTRNLEIHHIIPEVTGYISDIIDSRDNLICVCGKCHGALTPKKLLIRCGIQNVKRNNDEIQWWLNRFLEIREIALAEWEGHHLSAAFMYDIWHDGFLRVFEERGLRFKYGDTD